MDLPGGEGIRFCLYKLPVMLTSHVRYWCFSGVLPVRPTQRLPGKHGIMDPIITNILHLGNGAQDVLEYYRFGPRSLIANTTIHGNRDLLLGKHLILGGHDLY